MVCWTKAGEDTKNMRFENATQIYATVFGSYSICRKYELENIRMYWRARFLGRNQMVAQNLVLLTGLKERPVWAFVLRPQ
ncbi:hypothetical protein RB24_18155 [Herbaspirillum rubrisubalbicans]|uniref:Uncharacterized protein n=1 Tax=Herbaspirillum rubrisubalbicans TaxID=80842 RepID=A0ABX9BY25_9BURK|nr:hypothetical protein RB24_18155 [Herbaspirillum rubrisubalbicans]